MEDLESITLPVILSPDTAILKSGNPLGGALPNGNNSSSNACSNSLIANYSAVMCLSSKLPCNRFLCSCLPTCAIISVVLIMLLFGRNCVKYCLLWLDTQEEWIVCTMFVILYTAVSFPLTWGYILLNLACGYHFGLLTGTVVTALAASVGIILAHLLMKHYFVGIITTRLLSMNILRSVLAVLESTHAFKLVAVSRLTPIPFGLQNALFAISPIRLWRYVGASALGLLPTQVISVYLGTTVRSMENVLADESTATMGYGVLLVQVLLSLTLLAYIVRRAREEIRKTVTEDLKGITVHNGKFNSCAKPHVKDKLHVNYIIKQWPYGWRTSNGTNCLLNRI